MSLIYLQGEIAKLYKLRGYNAGPQTLLIGAMEELGELAEAILLTECEDFKPSAKKLSPEYADARDPAHEVGDCITYLLGLCNVLGIEPHFEWRRKIPQQSFREILDAHNIAKLHELEQE